MKKHSQFVLLLLVSAALGPSAYSADLSAPVQATPSMAELSLENAITVALTHNPSLRNATGRVTAAAGRAMQSGLWANPELELSAEDWPSRSGGFSESKKLIGVSQVVPFPGKKSLDRQIGSAELHAAEAERELQRRDLVKDVKVAFFHALAAAQRVKVGVELTQFAQRAADVARKRVAAGAAAEQEQLRAEILLEQTQSELSLLEREQMEAKHDLVAHLGRPELQDVPLTGELGVFCNLAPLDQVSDQWMDSHPSLAAARLRRDRAGLDLRRTRLDPYPDPRVGVAGGREGNSGSSLVQLSVSLPLPLLDRGKGRRQEAIANHEIASTEVLATEQSLKREWSKACQRLRSAQGQVASYRERILPKAASALTLVQTGFEKGKFGLVDLLDTQRTVAEARLAYEQRLLELNTARAELEALLGRDLQATANP